MPVPAALPGIRRLASEVLAGLGEGALVALSVPSGAAGKRWLGWFLEALRGQIREGREPPPIELPPLAGSLPDPFSEIAATGRVGRIRRLDDLLEYFSGEGPLVLVIECEPNLGLGWKHFFDAVRRAFRVADARRLRPVLAVIVGSREYPPIPNDVGSRVFALWNLFRWEELRILAADVLPRNENALTRAWRVATYAGAANGDPQMLLRLCRESPDRLARIVELAAQGAGSSGGCEWDTLPVSDLRWDVPPGCIGPWSVGDLLGHTVDRGALRAVGGMAGETAERYVRAAIWREQLTGLFPVVVELGFRIVPTITSLTGPDWLREVPDEKRVSETDFRPEPKEVMDIFSSGRFGKLPKSIWSFLDLLRRTRNDLAHMSPIELRQVREIWQGNDVIGRRFRRPDRGTPR